METRNSRPQTASRASTSPSGSACCPPGGGELGRQRGVALIIVMTAIAILGIAVGEFSYNTRINIGMATHAQKETQAYFAARGGLQVALLSLEAKKMVDSLIGALAGGMGGANTQYIEVWRIIEPLCEGLSSGKFALFGTDILDLAGVTGVGMPKNQEFSCKVELEDGKINVNTVGTSQDKQTLYLQLRGLFMRFFHSDLYEENEREIDEIIGAIMDWADQDDARTRFENNLLIETLGGAGEDTGDYSKYGYKVKNASYDTVDELRYVTGVDEGVFCMLRDEATVYNTEKLNVNSANIEVLKGLICSHLTSKWDIYCDPRLREQGLPTPVDAIGSYINICRNIKNELMTPMFTSPKSFTNFLVSVAGLLSANPIYGALFKGGIPMDISLLEQRVGTKGKIWRITAEGRSGDVVKKISAVLDTSSLKPNKLVYWRE